MASTAAADTSRACSQDISPEAKLEYILCEVTVPILISG